MVATIVIILKKIVQVGFILQIQWKFHQFNWNTGLNKLVYPIHFNSF